MIRILLPLAFVAAIYFGPMFSVETTDSVRGESISVVTGDYFIGNAVECLREMKTPIGEDCASDGQIDDSTKAGSAITWAALLAVAAAAAGIVGLIPFVGRLTSVATIAAGLAGLGGMGFFMLTMMNTDAGLAGVQWGAYLAAGFGLLTTISGLSGMRGR